MKTVTLLVAFALLVCTVFSATQREDKLVLDSFDVDTNPLIIELDNSKLPQTLSASTTDSSIIGGERDLSLTATSGPDDSILTSGVSGGLWSVSAPHTAAGTSLMQYDGIDGSSTLVNNGLGGANLEANGADALHLSLQSDQDTTYTVKIYSSAGTSQTVISVPGSNSADPVDYYVPYSSFTGKADFTAVGAIEIEVALLVDVDALLAIFATAGPAATPTPTPTPTPNNPPPPPPPAASKSPAAPPPPAACACHCPVFHCGVVFATPGDDDDSVDDDTHDDDEFVYRPVYYGPEDDDFKDIVGDDDDNEMFSFEGHLTRSAGDDDHDLNLLYQANGSSSLAVSVFLLSIAALLI